LVEFYENMVASTYDLNNLKRINKERKKIIKKREEEELDELYKKEM